MVQNLVRTVLDFQTDIGTGEITQTTTTPDFSSCLHILLMLPNPLRALAYLVAKYPKMQADISAIANGTISFESLMESSIEAPTAAGAGKGLIDWVIE